LFFSTKNPYTESHGANTENHGVFKPLVNFVTLIVPSVFLREYSVVLCVTVTTYGIFPLFAYSYLGGRIE